MLVGCNLYKITPVRNIEMACTTCTYIIQATFLLKSISMWDQKSKRRIPHSFPKIEELVFLFGDGIVGELVFLLVTVKLVS